MYKGSEEESVKILMDYIRGHKREDNGSSTDEDIKAFIKIFMVPTFRYNLSVTSYGLKHIAERVIGHLFYGSGNYFYVSNERFKRCMDEVNMFLSKPSDEDSPNDVYTFRFNKYLNDILDIYNYM